MDISSEISKEVSHIENEKSRGSNWTAIDWGERLSLKLKEEGEFRIIRLRGKYERIYYSQIWDDKGKRRNIILPKPDSLEAKTHIIWRAIELVMSTDWNKVYTDSTGKKVYPKVWQEKLPEIYDIVSHNSQKPFQWRDREGKIKSIANKGWYPSQLLLWNCIDRMLSQKFAEDDTKKEHPLGEFDYCLETKKCKLISKDGFLPGVTAVSFLKEIDKIIKMYPPLSYKGKSYDELTEEEKAFTDIDPLGYDIIITKGTSMSQPYVIGLADPRHTVQVKYLKEGLLTKEEQEYAPVDLQPLSKLTSNISIYKSLGNKLKQIFYAINESKIYDEWLEVVEQEKELAKENNLKEENKTSSTFEFSEEENLEEEKHTEKREKVSETKERKKEETLSADLNTLLLQYFPKMNKADYKFVKNVVVENEKPQIIWQDDVGEMYVCVDEANCSFKSPQGLLNCPICGASF